MRWQNIKPEQFKSVSCEWVFIIDNVSVFSSYPWKFKLKQCFLSNFNFYFWSVFSECSLFGVIPSRSRKRLSALYRFSCLSLKELLISLLSRGTLSISSILNLLSHPCIFILFRPTFPTIKIRPVYLWPSFSKTPRLFNNRTKSPLTKWCMIPGSAKSLQFGSTILKDSEWMD